MQCAYRVTLLLLAVLFTVITSNAQQPTGSIEGTVEDQSGDRLENAIITITQQGTGRAISVPTNREGYFVARSLVPGKYTVKVDVTGFAAAIFTDVVVEIGQTSNVSPVLKVGTASEVVQVEGTAATLQVDTSRQTIDGVITAEKIEQLPVNGRNFLDLARLQPGVVTRDGNVIDPTKTNAYRAVTVNGSSGTATRVQIDGIDVTDETVGTTMSNISTDAVQEFQLSRASFDLSTSLTTSGAVSILSRSGSNQFHGSGFFFWRNEDLGARLDYQTTSLPYHRDQVGYQFGGPIIKDKLFFFSNWERTYQGQQSIILSTDFPQLNGNAALPVGIRLTTNKLDWNLNSRVKLFYSHSYSDDLATGGGANTPYQNVDWTIRHTVGADITGARMSHSIRFGRVNFNNRIESQEIDPYTFNRGPQGTAYLLTVGSYQLGPNTLSPQQTYQDNYQTKYDGSYIRGNHTFRFGGEVNRVILGGFASFAGVLSIVGQFNAANQSALAKVGLDKDPFAYPLQSFSTGPSTGYFSADPADNLPHGGHYNTRIAWYAGDAWRVTRRLTLNLGTRWEYDTGFFNGTSRDLPQLSVYGDPRLGKIADFPGTAFSPQVGFAWDPTGSGKTSIRGGFYLTYEMNIGNNTIFDAYPRTPPGIGPDTSNNTLMHGPDGSPIVIPNIPGCLYTTPSDPKYSTSVSAGNYSCLLGQKLNVAIPVIEQAHLALRQAYANFNFDPNSPVQAFTTNKGVGNTDIFPGTFKIPYSMQFSIGIQRELRPNMVLSADYVRIRGVGLPYAYNDYERRFAARTLDAAAARAQVASVLKIPVSSLTPAAVDAFLAANPTATINTFGLGTGSDNYFTGLTKDINLARIMSGGFSLYQGLQVRLDGRLRSASDNWWHYVARELSYTVSYALSRAKATSGATRGEFVTAPTFNDNFNSAYGPTGQDRTHIFTAGAVMTVPGGVRINQIWSFRTAIPLSVAVPFLDSFSSTNSIFTTDLNGDGLVQDILPGTNVRALGRSIKSFNQLNQLITAFNQNYAGTLTPAGQALVAAGLFTQAQLVKTGATVKPIPLIPLSNPWPFQNLFNLDARISRPIRIKEKVTAEPSLDVFNVFNHTGLGSYSGLTGTFGSLNYDYAADLLKRGGVPALTSGTRGRLQPNPGQNNRLLQIGIRVSF
jgi:Carboxypeptidase regulatory-like domain